LIDSANFTFDGTSLTLGTDVSLSRGGANRLDLAVGDSFNIAEGHLLMGDFNGATITISPNFNGLNLSSGRNFNLLSGAFQVATTTVIDSSRRVFTSSGTLGAGTLAYSFSDDTNTGIYGTGSDVLNFATAGADRVTIDSAGGVGIGDTTPTEAELVLGLNGAGNMFFTPTTTGTTNDALCWDSAGATLLYDCDATPADYAESYPTTADVTFAEIVMETDEQVIQTDGDKSPKLTKAVRGAGAVIGITSNNYHDFTSAAKGIIPDAHNPLPVALNGRVPVKVNLEGGAIKQGDDIALSSVPGVGKKATDSGEIVVGVALSDYTSITASGTVLVFVSNKTYQTMRDLVRAGLFTTDLNASSTIFATLLTNDTDTIWNRLTKLAQGFVNGVLQVAGVKTNRVETQQLCVGDTCVSETQLIELLENSQQAPSAPEPPPVPAVEPDSDPVVDSLPPPEISTEVPLVPDVVVGEGEEYPSPVETTP
jgi:hypothetical protein